MEQDVTGLASLARKKAAIMADVRKFSKDKRNEQQRYGYASAEAIFDTIRALMVTHGLVLFTSAIQGNQDKFTSAKGTPGLHTTVQYRMLWVDTETGATIEDLWLSEGDDYQDKGYSKCATLALKYYLLTSFVVSSGDDADDPDSGIRAKGQRVQQTPPKQAATARNFNDAGNTGTTNGTHPQNAPEAFSDGEIRNVQLTAVTVEKSAAGQPRMRFTTTDGMAGIFGYTRKPFIEGGWCDERDWLEQDTYTLPTVCPAKVVYHMHQDGGGYWTIASVESFQPDFLQPAVVNHDATPAATPSHKIEDPLTSELLEITHVEPRMATGRTLVKQWIGHAKIEDEHGSTHPVQILLFAEDRRQLKALGYDVSGWEDVIGQNYPSGITVTTYKDTVGRKLAMAWSDHDNALVAIERAR